jgi:hypothetical protein
VTRPLVLVGFYTLKRSLTKTLPHFERGTSRPFVTNLLGYVKCRISSRNSRFDIVVDGFEASSFGTQKKERGGEGEGGGFG